MKGRNLTFLIWTVCCVMSLGVSIFVAIRRSHRRPAPEDPTAQFRQGYFLTSPTTSPESKTGIARPRSKQGSSHGDTIGDEKRASRPRSPEQRPALLYFRANAVGEHYGELAVTSVDAVNRIQYSSDLRCNRLHFAHGVGICLSLGAVGLNYAISYATAFDQEMRPRWKTRLMGFPSRVRVSPSGLLTAVTLFRFGESYAALHFSTQTTILDSESGGIIADLEQFSVTRDGMEFKSPDFNFWGVTFAQDDNLLYATLWSQGKTYLVRGNLSQHSFQVIHNGVECPSLSPDGTRIVFKKRTGEDAVFWRIAVLDLQSSAERSLGESRSVDDQVEWLDNDHVLYALSEGNPAREITNADIWVLSVGTVAVPKLLLKGGFSPAIVRAGDVTSSSSTISQSLTLN